SLRRQLASSLEISRSLAPRHQGKSSMQRLSCEHSRPSISPWSWQNHSLGPPADERIGIEIGFCAGEQITSRSDSFYCLTSSTRRFLARPSSLSFEATGASGPTPWESSRAAAILYFVVRSFTTASARRFDKSMLLRRAPTASVWPTTCNLSWG